MSETEQDKKQKEQLINVLYKDLKKIWISLKNAQKEKQEFTSFTNEIMIDEKKQNYTNKQDLLDLKYIDEEQEVCY